MVLGIDLRNDVPDQPTTGHQPAVISAVRAQLARDQMARLSDPQAQVQVAPDNLPSSEDSGQPMLGELPLQAVHQHPEIVGVVDHGVCAIGHVALTPPGKPAPR